MPANYDTDHVVTVTVDDIATVIDGPDTVYRYDLPATGIIEGWAVPAVVDQIKDLCSEYWPDIEVIITADERTTEMLARTLLNKGIAAYSSSVLHKDDPPQPVESYPLEEPQPGESRATVYRPQARSGASTLLTLTNAAIAAVVLLVIALSWWAISSALPGATRDARAADETTVAPSPVATTSDPETEETVDNEPVTVSGGGLEMKTPPNYTLTARPDGAYTAEGPDPDLRIVVAADPVYGVQPQAVEAEVLRMVEEDPTLTLVEGTGEGKPVEYIELPGDGSQVNWTTWVGKDRQFSVGCHSRGEPTYAHKAACRMAADTLTYQGER